MIDSNVTALLGVVLNDGSYDRRVAAAALLDAIRSNEPVDTAALSLAVEFELQERLETARAVRTLVGELGLTTP
ncbi:hypothetical protein SAMN05216548_108101 [Faunimonas pinastri]|uniref:Uncharacterized protein n=1 Tax=Faunimonas pinastri TaxID=1855383 RepID=A0A1H9JFE4_9HYPH|nr:hypothetical protein [Faunimonas pinastri]SEQ85489.1 hypothetical protein SAMN05216548_108101 [Faunimonas pinastri]